MCRKTELILRWEYAEKKDDKRGFQRRAAELKHPVFAGLERDRAVQEPRPPAAQIVDDIGSSFKNNRHH
jgi:hypothetical protein